MEIKSNVRQRRMDRMKQLVEAGQPASPIQLHRRDELPSKSQQVIIPMGEGPILEEPGDLRWQDPEFAWKQRDRFRNEQASPWKPATASWQHDPKGPEKPWLSPPTSRQVWTKFGLAAVIFAITLSVFRMDHPLALKGRQWVSTALTEDYNFAAAAAWYEYKFSGLPAVLPASWRRSDPETQKATTVNARQLYSPVKGTIIAPYSFAEPMMLIETSESEAKALDAGRVIAVVTGTGTDNRIQVVIQHANGLQSTYGGLSQTGLKKLDWIKGGETVGQVAPGTGNKAGKLLFALKKDNQWIDPTEVIPFD